jgi:hypothetical protein
MFFDLCLEALKAELSKVESLEFIFTAPTFVTDEVTDKVRKVRREFLSPRRTVRAVFMVPSLKSSFATN